jgi:hypothetical protein
MTTGNTASTIRLDLNNPVFQKALFDLTQNDQRSILNTLQQITRMTWPQIYSDRGHKWEAIQSQKGPGGHRLYTFRISRGFRAIGYPSDFDDLLIGKVGFRKHLHQQVEKVIPSLRLSLLTFYIKYVKYDHSK